MSSREDTVGRISVAPSGTKAGMAPGMPCPAALRLPGLRYRGSREDAVGRISVAPSGTRRVRCRRFLPGGAALAGSGSGIPRSVSLTNTRRPQTRRPVSIANRPFLSASAKRVSRGAGTPAC
ncbi:hypothetical protein DMR27_18265 [Klebsiella variicola]|nr:hypothetical protein DMR27_18265 [Klebsiella variicola]